MKTLQNNFTTPEQSKRLLELGIPADSADCYFFIDGNKYDGVPRPFFLFPKTYEYIQDINSSYGDKILPCWSVGRLIEIYGILRGVTCIFSLNTTDIIDDIISQIKSRENYITEPDRGKAIELALSTAEKGDTVMLLGKGAESFIIAGEKKLPFSDKEQAENIILKKGL